VFHNITNKQAILSSKTITKLYFNYETWLAERATGLKTEHQVQRPLASMPVARDRDPGNLTRPSALANSARTPRGREEPTVSTTNEVPSE